jgi:hypothetical protein
VKRISGMNTTSKGTTTKRVRRMHTNVLDRKTTRNMFSRVTRGSVRVNRAKRAWSRSSKQRQRQTTSNMRLHPLLRPPPHAFADVCWIGSASVYLFPNIHRSTNAQVNVCNDDLCFDQNVCAVAGNFQVECLQWCEKAAQLTQKVLCVYVHMYMCMEESAHIVGAYV